MKTASHVNVTFITGFYEVVMETLNKNKRVWTKICIKIFDILVLWALKCGVSGPLGFKTTFA